MTASLTEIMEQLEHRKTAIDRALAALREIDATPAMAPPVLPAVSPEAIVHKRKTFSAATRRRMKEAQKARWARIKGEIEPQAPPAPDPPKAKRQISAEGMKRIIAATKKRWRLQRAAAKAA